MHLYPRMIAIMTFGGLALAACDKKADQRGPDPAITQGNADKLAAPVKPSAPSSPDLDQKPPNAAERRGPVDRAESIKMTLSLMEKGEFGQAFKNLDEGIVWTEIGLPDGELKSIAAIIDYQNRSRTGFSDFHMKPKRIIASADYQAVEFVWSARHTGAFADGTPATNKVATLPGAMLIRYQGDGLIDRVWVFQDWPNALQQLGLSRDLPAGFVPFPLPDRAEIVLGPDEPRLRQRYLSFVSRLGPNDYRATIDEITADDFVWTDLQTGRLVAGREATLAFLSQRMGSFALDSTELETAISTGTFFAGYATNKYVYKGGFMGIAAQDQKITTHTLDIVQFDAEKMRFKTLASYGNSYEILAALGVSAGAAPDAARAGKFLIAACDDYVADMRECIESMDGQEQAGARLALDQQIVAWQSDSGAKLVVDKVRAACEAARDEARVKVAASCPRVVWN